MDNQHQKIKGYRELTQTEIDLMNESKELAEQCRTHIEKLEKHNNVDHRWLAIGRTDLQRGFMGIIRAVAQPETF